MHCKVQSPSQVTHTSEQVMLRTLPDDWIVEDLTHTLTY